jgi:hypothetical protein
VLGYPATHRRRTARFWRGAGSLLLRCGGQKRQNPPHVKYWEIIADNLSKAGRSWGCVATVDRRGRTMFVADAHRDDGKRFVVRADEKRRRLSNLKESRGRIIALPKSRIVGHNHRATTAIIRHK